MLAVLMESGRLEVRGAGGGLQNSLRLEGHCNVRHCHDYKVQVLSKFAIPGVNGAAQHQLPMLTWATSSSTAASKKAASASTAELCNHPIMSFVKQLLHQGDN
jgi:hypothetical protein